MADLKQMSRVLYHHDWACPEDWARNVAQLAELTDEQIGELQHCCRHEAGRSAPAVAEQAGLNRPQRLWRRLLPGRAERETLRAGWRFPLRRAC